MTDLITVHRLGLDPIEIPHDQIIWIDHSRVRDGKCPRKRYLRYELDRTGIVSPSRNENFVIGGTVHEGLDLLLQGGTLEKALEVAIEFYNNAPEWPDYYLPEQQQILSNDGLHLALAFVYGYNYAYLPELLANYEVLEVEEEINWLVTELTKPINSKRYIVMMSRPDGVLRDLKDNSLWHVSHKTFNGTFDDLQIEKLKIDTQRFSESLAIQAKYQQPVTGTLYNYFLKGVQRKDEKSNLSRYVNGLIRPYMLRQSPGGEIIPEMLKFLGEWEELDPKAHVLRTKRVGKGYERVSIYNEMDYWTYISWLEHQMIDPVGLDGPRDYLAESIAAHVPVFMVDSHAERWLEGLKNSEINWANIVSHQSIKDHDDFMLNRNIPLEHSECFSYNKRCSYHAICWRDSSIEDLISSGQMVKREANHLQETFFEDM